MSERFDFRLPVAGRLKMTACSVAAVLSLTLGAGSAALAQDATPAATPAATCTAPALPPGAPSTPGASPAADGMNMATPAAEAATPAATAAPAEATPADSATAAEIDAAAQNVAACANSGDYNGFVALLTPNLLQTLLGVTNPYDAVEGLKSQGQVFIGLTTANEVTYADGSVGVDSTYFQTKYQEVSEHWTLIKDGDYWKVDSVTTLSPQTDLDSAVVGVDLAGAKDASTGKYVYSITPASPSANVTPALYLHVRNLMEGAEDHELVVLKLPDGADPKGILDGSIKDSDIQFIGQVTVPSGTEQDLLLVGLPAGTYTFACFFQGPDGVPHAAEGMITQFTINPAS